MNRTFSAKAIVKKFARRVFHIERQVFSEKQVHWEAFLNDLYMRGLRGENLKLIIGDLGKGLLAFLPLVYGQVSFQRCWAHKVRNVLNYVRRGYQKEVKKDVHCLKTDMDDLLTFLQINTSLPHSALRTTNAIERRFREVRRRTRPMGVFSNHTSVERIIFSVFSYENLKENTATLFPILTQNN